MNKIYNEVYIKWYKLARVTVGDSYLIPKRTDEDIINNQVSNENWLNLSPAKNLVEVASSVNPNIWFSIHASGCSIGVHFNNEKSMNKIKNILRSRCDTQKTELENVMKELDNSWKTTLSRKKKEYHPMQPPKYEPVITKPANHLDDIAIVELFTLSQKIAEEGRKQKQKLKELNQYYSETPTLNLVECDFALNKKTEEEFKTRILIAHRIMEICYHVKTDHAIKKEVEASIDKLKKERNALKKLIQLDSKIVPKNITNNRRAKVADLEIEIRKLEEE